MKKKALITLAVFLIGIIISGLTVYQIVLHKGMDIREKALLNATAYGERIENEIYNGISITADLQQALIASDGKTDKFNTIAGNLMNDYVESIQLAPNGVVTDIYPDGNDAGKSI